MTEEVFAKFDRKKSTACVQWRRLRIGHGARAPIFTNSWKRGGAPDPYQGFLCPWTKLSDFRLSDNLTPHHHRGAVPQTVGPEPQDTGACPTFTNSWARRATWGKQETHQSVLSATKAFAKMTTCNCTHRAINLNNFLYRNKSGTLVADVG